VATVQNNDTRPARALVVVAHPDDAEFSVAGTVALWARQGTDVFYVICTDGSRGSSDPNITPQQLAQIRVQEQLEAASVLGVKDVVFLGYTDGLLEPTIALRRDITRMIRKYRPDALFCQDPTQRWHGREYINHPDHLAAGEAALAAVYPAARDRLAFPELLVEGLEPHKVPEVYLMGTEQPDRWIDISPTIDLKIRALLKHRSQVNPESLERRIRDWGRRAAENQDGMEYAEAFKYFQIR